MCRFAILALLWIPITVAPVNGAGGTLTFKCDEESDQSPTIARTELWRGSPHGKPLSVRRTVSAGIGFVVDRSVELTLADGPYSFRVIRGPEYRIVSGSFTMEKTSSDQHTAELPRMIHMLDKGWTSGDCLVVASKNSLPLRMASEDLHMATTLGHVDANPIPHRDANDPIGHDPLWIQTNASHYNGLAFYGDVPGADDEKMLPVQRILAAKEADKNTKVAIENPFAWPLPVWLASQKIDGFFLLGDWLRLDRKIVRIKAGRPRALSSFGGGQAMGRWAEEIYRNVLDAGLQIPLLAGGGSDSAGTPVGYNRLYVGRPLELYEVAENESSGVFPDAAAVATPQAWWDHAWMGHSVATNGPLLRPQLENQIPGHVFTASAGEVLELQPALSLSVRDPVEYLEVIHNNRVHYSARLDEFAKAGGVIPKLIADKSGWVIVRVITLHEDHYRAAVSAPWYIEFDGQRRVSKKSVEFFLSWLADYERRLKNLPADQLQRHVPFVRAARKFWADRAAIAVD
ncbi:MAG: hypothetical protein HKN47_08505 [Pirellulaceae bacterium]|nr:hypothetical protein [Pirellulaceae bacterium]